MITATRYRALAEINRQSTLSADVARAQSDISTGKRIEKPSDDPIASARIAQLRRAQADAEVWARNIQTAKSIAAQVDTALGDMGGIFNRVKELTLAGRTESVSDADRSAIVLELNQLRDSLTNLSTSTTPTGQALFPTDAPLRISTSATQRLPATAQRSDVFDGVATSQGSQSLDWIIGQAISAISNNDVNARRTAAATALDDIDKAVVHVTNQRAAQGLRAGQLDDAADALVEATTQLSEERSSLEDTDVAATVMRLNAKTLALQAAQAAFAKVNRNTLFDFLS